MFNDEEPLVFKKMHEYSPVDGFVEVTECLAEMMKFVANEPSVGLFYIQQHTKNAATNLVNFKNDITEKSHEIALHEEDSEDSITMMRSMKDCGLPIADEMIRDIKSSLAIMKSKPPKRGLITSSSWSPAMFSRNSSYKQEDATSSDGASGYFSNVFRSAKQKASNFRFSQPESSELNHSTMFLPGPSPSSVASESNYSAVPDAEGEEFPLSSHLSDLPSVGLRVHKCTSDQEMLSMSHTYEEFKAYREAKLEEWLEGMDNDDLHRTRSQS
ncbi:hypothetical protein Leryth_008703 [Lithospermum erythrorhizon]|nr:hypothetical protein Leryth_008703 [Lithospermum erythrorhizon]